MATTWLRTTEGSQYSHAMSDAADLHRQRTEVLRHFEQLAELSVEVANACQAFSDVTVTFYECPALQRETRITDEQISNVGWTLQMMHRNVLQRRGEIQEQLGKVFSSPPEMDMASWPSLAPLAGRSDGLPVDQSLLAPRPELSPVMAPEIVNDQTTTYLARAREPTGLAAPASWL